MLIEIPKYSLVVLSGASCAGKSTFAKNHFKPTEIFSSDNFRSLVSDDENDQKCSELAFDAMFYVINKRLQNRKLTVIDATNCNYNDNSYKTITQLSRDNDVPIITIILDLPDNIIFKHFENRTDGRNIDKHKIKNQISNVKRFIKSLTKYKRPKYLYIIDNEEDLNNTTITIKNLDIDKSSEHSKLDIIGDIHGCYDELLLLLNKLGYDKEGNHPENRKLVFLGDLCDRGPKNLEVLDFVKSLVESRKAYCVKGNHDNKLYKRLKDPSNIKLDVTDNSTLIDIHNKDIEYIKGIRNFLKDIPPYLVFDDCNLVVSHAGIKEEFIMKDSNRIYNFCLNGDTTGENDEYGLPIRNDWASLYKGNYIIVYGHTPTYRPIIKNRTYNIDTGCVFGGMLTAFRYPEKTLVSVNSLKEYIKPIKPLTDDTQDDNLSINNMINGLSLLTKFKSINISSNRVDKSIETISRFSVDPHWLIYLPPTMSPCKDSDKDDYLEYPTEAFDYYIKNNIKDVICEQKHMGSRAVIVLCKNAEYAKERFNVKDGSFGCIYTRTGKPFFRDINTQNEILTRLNKVLEKTKFWDDFKTNWVCLDTELMPWSSKAKDLLVRQYAPTGQSGLNGLNKAFNILNSLNVNNYTDEEKNLIKKLSDNYKDKIVNMEEYKKEYEKYCWDVKTIDDYKIAPFHILATESSVHTDETHIWHMHNICKYITNGVDKIFICTPFLHVNLNNKDDIDNAINWWLKLTVNYEGMVVKPVNYIEYNQCEDSKEKRIIQPAIKCRGRDYLRIIYGPDYLIPEYLIRLKNRSLSKKRALAIDEFILGIEALERFVNKEPLQQVHDCIIGINALENDPTDPRL